MIKLYIKKPIPITAIQWFGPEDNDKLPNGKIELWMYTNPNDCPKLGPVRYQLRTYEGPLKLTPGCWIVGPGAKGEFWPIDEEIFRMTYEEYNES